MRKPRHGVVVALALCLLSVAGASAQPADTLVIPGTGDSQDLLRELAALYQSQTGKLVEIPDSTGSSGGIESAGTGATPLGRTAVRPSVADHQKHGGLYYRELARVPVVFVTHERVGLTALTEQQLCDIYSGKLTNWSAFGGPDAAIRVQTRPEDGSNMVAIREKIACFKDLKLLAAGEPNERNADLVASIGSKPGAIGFMPLSEARKHKFRYVKLGTKDPNARDYSVWISLGFVHKAPALEGNAKAFLDWLATDPAQAIIRRDHIPVLAASEPPPDVTTPDPTAGGITPPPVDDKDRANGEDKGGEDEDKDKKKSKFKFSGYIQSLYTYQFDNKSGVCSNIVGSPSPINPSSCSNFTFQRGRARVDVEVIPDRFSLAFMLELAQLPAVAMRDAYGAIHLGSHDLRFGQFKLPFGFENPYQAWRLPMIERSIISKTLSGAAGGQLRDMGIGLFGSIPLVDDLKLEDAFAVVNGTGENKLDDTPRKDVFGRIGIAKGKVFRFGVSGSSVQYQRPDSIAPTTQVRETSYRYGADLEIMTDQLLFAVELAQAHYTQPDKRKRHGGYVLGAVRLPENFQIASRFEVLEPNTLVDDDTTTRLYLQLNHYPAFSRPDNVMFSIAYRHDFDPVKVDMLLLRGQWMM